jgi:hypothetical protein
MNGSPHHHQSTADLNGTYLPSDWARSRIAAWLDSAAPALLLTGPAGSGKTALAGRLANWVGAPCAVHYCRTRSLASTYPVTVMAGITAALCRAVPGYADAVIGQRPRRGQPVPTQDVPKDRLALRTVQDSPDGHVAYDRALHGPLSILSGSLAGHVLVVIDGVDEASDRGGNLLVDVLAAQAATRTPHLRLLLTGRPGPALRRLRDHAQIDLADDPSTPDAIHAVLASVTGLSAKARRAVAAAARGSYLYGLLVAQSPDLVARPPDGIDAAYDRLLADLDPLPWRVLEVVCASRDEGLTAEDLGGVLAAGDEQIGMALARLRHILWGGQFRAHHRCLAEYAARRSPPPDGAIAEHFIRRYGAQWESCADSYPLRNLLAHLADAAFRELSVRDASANSAQKALAAVLADTRYLTAALAAAGVDAVRAALSYVRYHAPGRSGEFARAASRLGLMLSANSHLLRDGAAAAVNQLVYTALSTGDHTLAAGLATAVDDRAIQVLWATNDDEIVSAPDRLRGHDTKVTALFIAANGTHAFSASTDGTMRRWRLASGRPDRVLPMPERVAYLHSGPDATEVFAAYRDATAHAWDTHSGDGRLLNGPLISVTAFAISSDATRALSADKDRGITLWALEDDAKPLWRSPRQPERVTSVALTADGHHGAAAIANGEVTLWDLLTGQVRLRLRHTTLVTAVCLTPPGDRLVIGDNETLTVLDATIASSATRARDTARLVVRAAVTALAANPVLDRLVLFGTASGQVTYVRVP